MGLPLFLVDAFSFGPFTGNPAAVCLLDTERDDQWMQNLATEMNQAETAFVWPENGAYRLRWFTPAVEVDLCGHATLATAHVLFETGRLSSGEEAAFQTKSGLLVCRQTEDQIVMDFPQEGPEASPLPAESQSLLPHVVWTGKNRMDWFVALSSEAEVLAFKPDLQVISDMGLRGLVLTAPAHRAGADYVSRFFAPQSGVPEDHVTGSAHCALAPYWNQRLGKNPTIGFQASRRGGFVSTEVRGDRVVLGGKSLTVTSGTVHV